MWEEEINRIKVGEERRGKGGGGGGKKKKGDGKMRSLKQCCFLSLNTCSFFCTLIASWQVELAVSRPCLLQALI